MLLASVNLPSLSTVRVTCKVQAGDAGNIADGHPAWSFMAVETSTCLDAFAMDACAHLIDHHHHSCGQLDTKRQSLVCRQAVPCSGIEVWPDHVELVVAIIFGIRKIPADAIERRCSASTFGLGKDSDAGFEVVSRGVKPMHCHQSLPPQDAVGSTTEAAFPLSVQVLIAPTTRAVQSPGQCSAA